MGKILKAIHADDAAHYEKLGLIPHQVQLWEDGMRTDGSKGTYEYETPAGEFYRITYHRRNDISRQNFVDVMPGYNERYSEKNRELQPMAGLQFPVYTLQCSAHSWQW